MPTNITHCQYNVYKHQSDGIQAQYTKGQMHSTCMLLPDHIVCQISQRNYMRIANTCDPALKLLNEKITSNTLKHKQNIWNVHLDAHWDYRHNTYTLWKTIHGLSKIVFFTHIQHFHHVQQQNNHHTQTYCVLFLQTSHKHFRHVTHKTNRSIGRAIQKPQGYNITLTTTQIQEAIKQNNNNNSRGPVK